MISVLVKYSRTKAPAGVYSNGWKFPFVFKPKDYNQIDFKGILILTDKRFKELSPIIFVYNFSV